MSLSTDLEILNRALRDLSGSFLQYVAEVWPWTSVGADGDRLRSVVNSCVARQQQSIACLAEYLAQHQPRVEFGEYSSEFTDLHYVSLKFLVQRLIKDQIELAESLRRATTLLPNGAVALHPLSIACQNESENLESLKAAG